MYSFESFSNLFLFFFNDVVRILVSDYKRPVPIITLSALILELICYVIHVYFCDVVRVLVTDNKIPVPSLLAEL